MTSTPLHLLVIHCREGWRIIYDGRRWGRFDYQVDAVDAALRLVRKMAIGGATPQLLVQERWGEPVPLV
jgi:hypothetical protein